MPGPLEGARVLDFTHGLAGPFGTMILADLGAEVILVSRVDERDGNTRGGGPFVNGRSTYRFSLERGKRNIQLDLKKPEGIDLALRLAERVDVLAENFVPGTMDRLGLGYEAVARRNPRIIYASISGHGQTGPYAQRAAFDIVAQAMSGLMSITGEPDGRPMRVGASYGDTIPGAYMAMGILAAFYERERSGVGQRLDIAMVESLLYHNENPIIRYSATGVVPDRVGPRHPLSTPFQPFETKDGWIVIGMAAARADWQSFCVVIGHEELAEDPRFKEGPTRNAHHGELEPILMEVFRKKTTQEWLQLLDGVCIAAPVYNIAEAINDPQIKARGAVIEMPVPGLEKRTVLLPNTPIRLSRTAPAVERPAPWAGEHTREVLHDLLGLPTERIDDLDRAGVLRCL